MAKSSIATTALVCLILIIAVLLAVAMQDVPVRPLTVATNVWPGYEPLYLARERGAWGAEQVRLIECSSATQTLRLFRNRIVDVAAVTLDEALLLRQDGIDVRVFLVADISNGADVIVANQAIDEVAGLVGHKVGVESTAVGAFVLTRACQLAGIAQAKLQVVALEIHEQEEAFLTGQVSAVVTFEPVASRLISAGAKQIFSSKQIPGEILDVLVTRSSVLESRGAAIQLIVDGWFGSLASLQQNPAAAIEQMTDRLDLTTEQVSKALEAIDLPSRQQNLAYLDGEQPLLIGVASRLQATLLRDGLLRNDLLQRRTGVGDLVAPGPVVKSREGSAH